MADASRQALRKGVIPGDLVTRLIEARISGGPELERAVYDAFELGLGWKAIAQRVGYGRTRLYELRNAEQARREKKGEGVCDTCWSMPTR